MSGIDGVGGGGFQGLDQLGGVGDAPATATADAPPPDTQDPATASSQQGAMSSMRFSSGMLEGLVNSEYDASQAGYGAGPEGATCSPEVTAGSIEGTESPLGIPYIAMPQPDLIPLMKDGKFADYSLVLLSQFDLDAKTCNDATRCGPTAAIGAAIATGDPEKLVGLCDAAKGRSTDPADQAEAQRIKDAIRNGNVTMGDMNKLGELLLKAYPATGNAEGVSSWDMQGMYADAGLEAPGADFKFKPGQSWPFRMDTDGDGMANHWVTAGRGQDGKAFIYDPMGIPHLMKEGEPAYDMYMAKMKAQTDGGFAPITYEGAAAQAEEWERRQAAGR